MIEQRSEQWHQQRLGCLTGSRMAEAMARTKSGYGASRKNLMAEKAVERLTGQPAQAYVTPAMQRGTDLELDGTAATEAHTGLIIEEVGFVPHPTIERFGSSPDGLINDDGTFELKAPNTAQHIEMILTGKVERKYWIQSHCHMAVTGRQYTLFASFDDRMPDQLQLWTVRIERDDELIAEIEDEARKFLAELDRMEAALWARIAVAEDAA